MKRPVNPSPARDPDPGPGPLRFPLPVRPERTDTTAESSSRVAFQAVTEPALFLVDAKRLARLLGVGVRTVRTWDSAGKIPAPVRIVGRVAWRLDEIRRWVDAGAPCRADWEAIMATSENNSSRTLPRS